MISTDDLREYLPRCEYRIALHFRRNSDVDFLDDHICALRVFTTSSLVKKASSENKTVAENCDSLCVALSIIHRTKSTQRGIWRVTRGNQHRLVVGFSARGGGEYFQHAET